MAVQGKRRELPVGHGCWPYWTHYFILSSPLHSSFLPFPPPPPLSFPPSQIQELLELLHGENGYLRTMERVRAVGSCLSSWAPLLISLSLPPSLPPSLPALSHSFSHFTP